MPPFRLRTRLPHYVHESWNLGPITSSQFFSPADKLYAFSMVERGAPRVFVYDATPDGLESLSHLVRSEEVIAVIRGRELEVKQETVVLVNDGVDLVNEHRYPLKSM